MRIPARIVAKVEHHPGVNYPYSWYYTVDAYPLGYDSDDPAVIDFGSVESKEQAWACVEYILTNRDKFDMQEFFHVPHRKRTRRIRGRKVEVTTITYSIEVDESDYDTAANMQNAVVELVTDQGFSVDSITPETVHAYGTSRRL